MRADNLFDRQNIFARLGSLRGFLLPQHISDIAITIQQGFLVEGAKQHGKYGAKVWTGQFTRKLMQEKLIDNSSNSLEVLFVKDRFQQIGLDLNWLLSLPAEELFEITNLKEWKVTRDFLLGKTIDSRVVSR